jgi:hypothetical protein
LLQAAMPGLIQHLAQSPLLAGVMALEMEAPELPVVREVRVAVALLAQMAPEALGIPLILVRRKAAMGALAILVALAVVAVVVLGKRVTQMGLVTVVTVLHPLFLAAA